MNILIVTSYSTGQGHKSITEALLSQFKKIAPEDRTVVIDGFETGNVVAKASGRAYNALAVYAPWLWGAMYAFFDAASGLMNKLMARSIKNGFLERIEEIKPDVIVSVHAAFVGSILDIMEKAGKSVPVVVVVADLDNVTSLWLDKRAASIICPTEEAARRIRSLGMPEEKVKVVGLPVRERFLAKPAELAGPKDEGLPLALLISGSQGSKKSRKMIKALLDSKRCRVRAITGSNALLKSSLELLFCRKLGQELEVLGFTQEVDKHMREADFLIARASPNVLMEAVCMEKPLIVTETFYGQERKNPQFILNHNLGIECRKLKKLPDAVDSLMKDGQKLYDSIRESQKAFKNSASSALICEMALSAARESKSGVIARGEPSSLFEADFYAG
jgi:processive 1,2-diacylglycerol beta-glucosyltransferase